jgi:hypothetical protein
MRPVLDLTLPSLIRRRRVAKQALIFNLIVIVWNHSSWRHSTLLQGRP